VNQVPTTPYLIRAIYEWCCDSGQTPYMTVRVDAETRVPMEYVKNGEIILNTSSDATRNLKIDNDVIRFSARFNGASREISIPVGAVKGIFAKESGQGLAFQVAPQADAADDADTPPEFDPADTRRSPSGGRVKLQVVK
jgi:stringent starvation protein B